MYYIFICVIKTSVVSQSRSGAQAIQKIFPETKIILHESTTEFERFAPANNRGFYDTNENVIHIDLNKALATTVPHEIFHATLLNKIKTDAEAAKLAENMMRSVRKALPKNSPLARRIDEFAAKYEDQPDFQNEERLAELMGIMASEYTQLTKPQKNKVIKFLQDLANKIGLNINFSEFTQQDSDVVDLFNTLAGKVATGEAITETDIEILEPGTLIPNAEGKIPSNIKESDRTIGREQKTSYQLNRGGIDMSSIKYGSINELSGATAFVYAADKATYGLIKSPSGLEFNFYGGYLYPYGSGKGWAFTDKSNAQKVLNKVKESDGVGLVMIQGDTGITGSRNFYQYLNAEIAHAINKGANPNELLNYVNKILSNTDRDWETLNHH